MSSRPILGSDAEAPLKPVRQRVAYHGRRAILGSDAEAPLKQVRGGGRDVGRELRSSAAMPRPR